MSQTMERPRSGLAVGFIVFAGVAMVMIGAFHALQGLVALFNDDFYVVGQKWIFEFDLTTWGWIHLIVGVVVAVAGFFVFNGAVWARAVGIAVAALSAVLNFMWLPYYPIWSLIIIALDVLVIWALSVHGRDFSPVETQTRPGRSASRYGEPGAGIVPAVLGHPAWRGGRPDRRARHTALRRRVSSQGLQQSPGPLSAVSARDRRSTIPTTRAGGEVRRAHGGGSPTRAGYARPDPAASARRYHPLGHPRRGSSALNVGLERSGAVDAHR